MQSVLNIPLVLIDKEFVGSLKFPKEEVLDNPALQDRRMNKLFQAAKLGNLENYKATIDFQDNTGFKRVHTSIWSITERFVILKSITRIPINRIVEIKML